MLFAYGPAPSGPQAGGGRNTSGGPGFPIRGIKVGFAVRVYSYSYNRGVGSSGGKCSIGRNAIVTLIAILKMVLVAFHTSDLSQMIYPHLMTYA